MSQDSTEERLAALEALANTWKWRLAGVTAAVLALVGISLLEAPSRAISAFSSSRMAHASAQESARLAELTGEHEAVARRHRAALENRQSLVWGRWKFGWQESQRPASPLEGVTVQHYTFPDASFETPPVVFVAIEYYDTDPSSDHVRMLAVPGNVNPKGFDLQLTYEASGKAFHLEGKWVAIPSEIATRATCQGVACEKGI